MIVAAAVGEEHAGRERPAVVDLHAAGVPAGVFAENRQRRRVGAVIALARIRARDVNAVAFGNDGRVRASDKPGRDIPLRDRGLDRPGAPVVDRGADGEIRDAGGHLRQSESLERPVEGARGQELDAARKRRAGEEAGGSARHVGRPGRQVEPAAFAPMAAFEVVEPLERIVVFDVAGAGLAQDRTLQVTQAPGGRRVVVIVLLLRDRRLPGRARRGTRPWLGAVRQHVAARGNLPERGAGGHDARLLRRHRRGQLAELHDVARAARRHDVQEFAFGSGEPASLDAHQIGARRHAVECEFAGPIGLGQRRSRPCAVTAAPTIGCDRSSVTWPSIQPDVREAVCDTAVAAEATEAAEADTVGMISSGPSVLVRVV